MAVKVTSGQLAEAAEKAAEKGGKAISDFERLLEKASDKVADEFTELMNRGVKSKGGAPVKPSKKPLPEPSKPAPQLKVEEPSLPGAAKKIAKAPRSAPQTSAEGLAEGVKKLRKRLRAEDEFPGLVKIVDVNEIVTKVLDGHSGWLEILNSLLPGAVQGVKIDKPNKDGSMPTYPGIPVDAQGKTNASDSEKIMALVKAKRLAWQNKRKREPIKFPGRYPNVAKKPKYPSDLVKDDIMRRVGKGAEKKIVWSAPLKVERDFTSVGDQFVGDKLTLVPA